MDIVRHPGEDLFFEAILSLRTVEDCRLFFEDVATIKELQAMSQRFRVACLLDSGENYSTALDLAHLAQAALQNAQLRAVVSTKTAVCAGRTLTNHNKLLWRYDGCIGVKTGYTRHAGRILVSAAERDGRMLIAVTISDPDDWRDHTALLDYGFAVLGRDTPVYPQNRRIVWKNDCKKFWRAAPASPAARLRS